MQLFCRDGLVIATHDDAQVVTPSAYGEDVYVVPVADGTTLERVGPEPTDGLPDMRPFAVPDVTAEMLIRYTNKKQWEIATSGRVVTIAGSPVPFSTNEIGRSMMDGKVARLQQANAPASVNWQIGPTAFVTIAAADFLEAAIKIADWLQSTFDALPSIFAAIEAGIITTTSQIDEALDAVGS